jgi:hypothetical protein
MGAVPARVEVAGEEVLVPLWVGEVGEVAVAVAVAVAVVVAMAGRPV